mgnify:CR=1 FL=1|tara:strand:+ start:506 stop:1861 length:1356 start_codon:yes stop_codon:yes gene_type:complete
MIIKNLSYFLLFILLSSCSFDKATGLWDGSAEEKKKITELENKQKRIIESYDLYSSENIYTSEFLLSQKIIVPKPKKNLSWETSFLNNQNSLGNLFLPGIDKKFLNKKIGKNKFYLYKIKTSLLAYNNSLIFSDDSGTIFNVNEKGKINWKLNIYKKIYKKIYKNLTLTVYENVLYVNDNVGFIYAVNLKSGELKWIKNHKVPLKSKIKIAKDKIFLIDHDNEIFSISSKDGTKLWNIFSISSFIKSQTLMPLALSNIDQLLVLNSSADLFNVNINSGNVNWATNTSGSLNEDVSDFFSPSELVIKDDNLFFSSASLFFSFNLNNGSINWESKITSVGAPILSGDNIFFVTENGYFIIMDASTGNILSSNNILKNLRKKNRNTKVTGFIMGSGKIYSVTLNGNLIVSSATSGKTEFSKKIANSISTSPIINDGKLFILTENSKLIGFKQSR